MNKKHKAMKAFLREVLYWTLALIFAGIMLVGFCAEISVAAWLVGPLKVILAFTGFTGLYWSANQTTLGRRIADGDY